MSLTIKSIKSTDYQDILVKWWEDWGWDAPPKDFLPEEGTGGLMVWDDDMPVCAGFVYVTNSQVAWLDWIISNKSYRKKPQRKNALLMLIESLSNVSKGSGASYAYALLKHNSLIELYKENGFIKGDVYSSEMIKGL